MREKRGSGTFARRMEEALAPLLFFLFVILPLYLSITNPPLSVSHSWPLHSSQNSLLSFIPISIISLCVLPPFLMYLWITSASHRAKLGSPNKVFYPQSLFKFLNADFWPVLNQILIIFLHNTAALALHAETIKQHPKVFCRHIGLPVAINRTQQIYSNCTVFFPF